jgi:hypothetical protein
MYHLSAHQSLKALRRSGLITRQQHKAAKQFLSSPYPVQKGDPLEQVLAMAYLMQLATPNLHLH